MSYNPTNSISGNGVLGQVTATYTLGSSFWNIVTQNTPGQVLTGTFPNSQNANSITTQNFNFVWPFRGGKNLPNTVPRSITPAGEVGISVTGIVFYNSRSGITVGGQNGTIWNLNSVAAKILGEDIYGGRPTSTGVYNYHSSEFITNNAWGSVAGSTFSGGSYTQFADGHSKLVGWARDGYPIYGPYGYQSPDDIFSPVVRMQSGYQLNLRNNRPINRNVVVNGAVTSATSFLVYSTSGITVGMTLSGGPLTSPTKVIAIFGTRITVKDPVTLPSGSILTGSYDPGVFVEDWTHYPSDNVLDIFNGRYCVTPEYPNGTYAYFLTEDQNGVPSYPYIVGPSFYGSTVIDSTDTTLSNIIPSIGTLSPTFASTITNYIVTVPNPTPSIRFTAFLNSPLSRLKFNDSFINSGDQTSPVSLTVGTTTSTFEVISQYQSNRVYTVAVERIRKSIKNLLGLSVSGGSLSPSFDPDVTEYSVTYNTNVSSIQITAIKEDIDSSIFFGNTPIESGVPFTVNLNFGVNDIDIGVVAEDGTIKDYLISVTRLSNLASLSAITTNRGDIVPSFSQNVFSYSLSVAHEISDIRIESTSVDPLSTIFVDGVETPNNSLSIPVTLNVGFNPIGIRVVSSDGTSFQNYRINVFRQKSSNSKLLNLSLSSGVLLPTFDKNILSYTASVGNSIANISVSVIREESNSVVSVNDQIIEDQSSLLPLVVGDNLIDVRVTSDDESTETVYSIIVNRSASSISSLNNLVVFNANVSPNFASNIFNYSGTVTHNINTTAIEPTATDLTSSIRVNGNSVLSGVKSQNIPLNVGNNIINVSVTAQNNINTSTYLVNINRRANFDARLALLTTNIGTLVPNFDPEITDYSLNVIHNATELELSFIANDSGIAGVEVSNENFSEITTSSNGIVTVPLFGEIENNQWNGLNEISIGVVAADQSSFKIYRINAVRAPSNISSLVSLSVNVDGFNAQLSPTFEPDIKDYYLGVPNTVSEIRVIADGSYPLQDIFVNNILVQSGVETSNIPLYVGNNTIPILVYADDNNFVTGYNIFVNRAALGLDTNSLLSNLETDAGTFTTAFNPATTSYTVNVPYEVQLIRVKPTKQKTSSTIIVNGNFVVSGTFSEGIEIPVGTTAINIRVIAQDNTTTTDYTINVIKPGNSISTLKDLYVSYGRLDKEFNPSVTQYSVTVKNSIGRVSIRPFTTDSQAVLAINNLPSAPNEWSDGFDLNIGENVLTIRVVAGNLFNETIYQVKFIREKPGVVNPTDLFESDGINLSTNFITPNILRVFTRVNTEGIITGIFPNHANTWTIELQNLELVFPYRGGSNETAVNKSVRENGEIIGITLVGIPIRSPSSGEKIPGLNNTLWTFNSVTTGEFGTDMYGGAAGPEGYYYKDNRFLFEGAWDNKPEWNGNLTHPDGHSRIIGYAADGYPIYGPFGYSNPLSSYSPVIDMVPGFSLRENSNRPQGRNIIYNGNELGNLIQLESVEGLHRGMQVTGGPLDDFAESYKITIIDINTLTNYITLSDPVNLGPFAYNLTTLYGPGFFIEDFYFDPNKEGRTLDIHNGRYCVTPDYPFGTYAYFSTGNEQAPEFPYFIGPTFYGPLSSFQTGIKAPPKWVTPIGFIVTATEGISITRSVTATGEELTYSVLSGSLPAGLRLNSASGSIFGTPSLVYQTERFEFVIRAKNPWGVSDRKFSIDVSGATPPIITTPGPRPRIGPSGEQYLVNGQIVDFQFSATSDVLPTGKNLFFFIEDGDGQLPPGLILTSSGRLYGQVDDNLSLFYRAASDGRFDAESYDLNPFEHQSVQEFGVKNNFVNKVYRFFLSVSNGVSARKAEYIIEVNDPATYVKPGPYPVPVQWISPQNLGSFRSNSNVVIKLETHDCDPGGGTITYDWFSANNGNLSVIPEGLSLDTAQGIISGFIRYTPIYTTTYQFKLRVVKTSVLTGTTTFRDKTFNLTVLGSVFSSLTFETPSNVGSLYQGEQSELSIVAIHTDPSLSISYSLTSGSLPPGLSLSIDGTIQGQVNYNSTATTTVTYTFGVRAKDSSLTNEITGNFNINVLPYSGKKYVSIYMEPLLRLDSRTLYEQFINNQSIFDPNLLYRKYDSAFGIQTNVKFILEHAIEELSSTQYVSSLQNYFRRKRLEFGEIKSAKSTDANGNISYEVVYVELIDSLVNQDGVPVGSTVDFNGTTFYPNSINNMRAELEKLGEIDEFLWPRFMRTIQSDTGTPLGRILCMPLCYCLPDKARIVINRIKNSGFNFKKINFEVDRIIVSDTLDGNATKYLLFPNRKVLD